MKLSSLRILTERTGLEMVKVRQRDGKGELRLSLQRALECNVIPPGLELSSHIVCRYMLRGSLILARDLGDTLLMVEVTFRCPEGDKLTVTRPIVRAQVGLFCFRQLHSFCRQYISLRSEPSVCVRS